MFEVIWLNRGTILLLSMLAVGVASLKLGGGPERWLSGSILTAMGLDRLYHFAASGGATVWRFTDYSRLDVGHLVLDGSLLIIMVTVALRANRVYVLWIAGLQIVTFLSHFGRGSQADIHPLAYAIMTHAPFYLQMVLLVAGLVLHVLRKRRRGAYRDWR